MQIVLDIPMELQERLNDWSVQSQQPIQRLAVELLEEYFDDCDDADRLEALIRAGKMETYSADEVHKELAKLDTVES